jgi:DNA polymerase-3 subunit epsilon
MDFVAIDFETANGSRSSACALGMVKVKQGVIVETWYSHIQPEPEHNWVAAINYSIHGISQTELDQAPRLAKLWPSASTFIEDYPLVAHNMSFDRSVLGASLDSCGLTFPANPLHCSLKFSKVALPGLAAYKLPYVAEHLGISGLNHHDALSDAETCAEIFIYLISNFRDIDLEQLSSRARTRVMNPIAKLGKDEWREKASAYIDSPENLINGHSFTLTGGFDIGIRDELVGLLSGLGGNWIKSTSKKTTLLVQGEESPSSFRAGAKHSIKFETAEELKSKGQDIEVIDQSQLLEMLPSELLNSLVR